MTDMSITLPAQTVAFQSPILSLPARWDRSDQSYIPPPEGSRFVPFEIDWQSYSAGGAVACNVYGNQPNAQLSRIVALSVDNVDCGSDVQFIFPDTAEVLTVPAYAGGVFPVFTGATNFYVVAPNAVLSDVTRFKAHNTLPPPVALEKTEYQDKIVVTAINLAATAITQIIPISISGTLNGISVSLTAQETTSGLAGVLLQDAVPNDLWGGNICSAGAGANVMACLTGLKIRFIDGVKFNVTNSTIASGSAWVSLYYQVP